MIDLLNVIRTSFHIISKTPIFMPETYVIRYGSTRTLGEFTARTGDSLRRNSDVIIRTNRGVEWGKVLCPATERTGGYLGEDPFKGKVLRIANEQDYKILEQTKESISQEFSSCEELIAEQKLQMNLVDVEHIFGGERVIFYYLAEKRVDFRQLVKDLAKRHRTRVEMRQIGVRDEAKLLADYGDCGKEVCCATYLTEMPPVSMKMAKIQKATLDPNKLSGRCGRLKCCLRYEYDTYVEYRRELPRIGAMVVTKQGEGKVINQEILARKILVLFKGKRPILIDEGDVLTVIKNSEQKQKKEEAPPSTSA
ncbi:Stage 0 sporulation protein YaaT [hydrothermal vent metagenome]|uniref:Stage 0 sporulation protein YaaT n=1 Tax=hydrothermal vent metagenome TaxID=652676 RepID=A0A3B1DNW9_9ZZZZ